MTTALLFQEWIFGVPAQIALVTSQIVWTEEVESALEELESGACMPYGPDLIRVS
jgi:hypothetical protein